MSAINTSKPVISTTNSSTSALGSKAEFTGTSEQPARAQVCCNAFSDKAGVLYMEFSADGTNWRVSHGFAVPPSTVARHIMPVTHKHFRARFVNLGAATQGTFSLQTIYGQFNDVTEHVADSPELIESRKQTALLDQIVDKLDKLRRLQEVANIQRGSYVELHVSEKDVD